VPRLFLKLKKVEKMSKKFNIALTSIFVSLTLVSVALSSINKIFLLLGLSMGISSVYSILSLFEAGSTSFPPED
jgi:hypothetical protein